MNEKKEREKIIFDWSRPFFGTLETIKFRKFPREQLLHPRSKVGQIIFVNNAIEYLSMVTREEVWQERLLQLWFLKELELFFYQKFDRRICAHAHGLGNRNDVNLYHFRTRNYTELVYIA